MLVLWNNTQLVWIWYTIVLHYKIIQIPNRGIQSIIFCWKIRTSYDKYRIQHWKGMGHINIWSTCILHAWIMTISCGITGSAQNFKFLILIKQVYCTIIHVTLPSRSSYCLLPECSLIVWCLCDSGTSVNIMILLLSHQESSHMVPGIPQILSICWIFFIWLG